MREVKKIRNWGRRKTFVLFILSYVFFLGLCFAALATFRAIRLRQYLADTRSRQRLELSLNKEVILHELGYAAADVRFLAGETELMEYWNRPNDKQLHRTAQEYEKFGVSKFRYDQIRLLDASGKELIRINMKNDRAEIVPKNELQDKSNRYYFRESLHLTPRQVYISPLDLNVENEKVEIPHKPMIRFTSASFDENRKLRGIVVLNLKAATIQKLLQKADELIDGEIQLVNKDGFWMHHPKKDYQWGWQLPGREKYNLNTMHPNIWSKISSAESGVVKEADGTEYEFDTIHINEVCTTTLVNYIGSYPPYDLSHCPQTRETWKLISVLPREVLAKEDAGLLKLLAIFFAVSAVVLLLPSWGLAYFVSSWFRRRQELYHRAHYDKVTDLPNRVLFNDRLGQAHKQAQRYGRTYGLLFIDLDGFKEVNDRLGHDAGDELLNVVGKRIEDCVRTSDTVARLGGDEFIVILTEITSHDDASSVAENIIEAVSIPMELDNGRANVGCSIGIAVYPDDADDRNELLFRSDAAMYSAKAHGKGQYWTTEKSSRKEPIVAEWRE